jgi:hypothetical protein
MKLKAPAGVGEPCVAGIALVPRGGVYDVETEIGALLIECFGFVEVDAPAKMGGTVTARRAKAPSKKA